MSGELGTVAVLGGSGFLGSHTADALSDAGYHVRIFDTRESPWRRPDQEMIVGDIRDGAGVARAVEGCQAVYHFAGMADIGDCAGSPVRTAEVNVLGTVTALEACRAAGVSRFLFASTVYVYSGHGAFYRASKQAAEAFIHTYAQEHGLEYTILRYGTLYGRRADHRNRIHALLNEALTTGKVRYPGSGKAIREFIHVRDAAALSVKTLAPAYANRHLVLTGMEKMSIEQLLLMIREISGNRVDVAWANEEPPGHYHLTPYSFMPEVGYKLVPDDYVDLGQGLLDTMTAILETNPDLETMRIDPGPPAVWTRP